MLQKENLERREIKEIIPYGETLDLSKLKNYYRNILGEDKLYLELFITDYSLHSKTLTCEEELEEFINQAEDNTLDDPNDFYELRISYIKNSSTLSIYEPADLCDSLSQFSFEELYNQFANRFESAPTNTILIVTNNTNYHYKSTLFTTNLLDSANSSNRSDILENCTYFTNFLGLKKATLLPSDFINQKLHSADQFECLDILLNKFGELLALTFLVDVVKFEGNKIAVKINSFNKINYELDYEKYQFENFAEIVKIYNWVYNSNSTFLADDKIIFAKNQLSRKLSLNVTEKRVTVDTSIFPSLLSMHSIYLKENANQYIETTNTVAELIAKLAIQQKEIQQGIINSFKSSSTVFLSLFISLLVFNTLSSGKTIVFNSDNYVLTLLFALISSIACFISHHQVESELKSVKKQFDDTKKVYNNILDTSDLDNLFASSYYDEIHKTVSKTRTNYTTAWVVEILLVTIIVTILTFTDLFDHIF